MLLLIRAIFEHFYTNVFTFFHHDRRKRKERIVLSLGPFTQAPRVRVDVFLSRASGGANRRTRFTVLHFILFKYWRRREQSKRKRGNVADGSKKGSRMFARERMGDESRRGESDGGNREEFKTKRVVSLSRRGTEQQFRPERVLRERERCVQDGIN
jgi:hypothetical protein